jgi:hypothetical protein
MAGANNSWRSCFLITLWLLPASAVAQTVTSADEPTSFQTAQPGISPVQDLPRIQLFAGYSALPDRDPYFRPFGGGHGWAVGGAVTLGRHVDLAAEFDRHSSTTPARTTCGSFAIPGCEDSYVGEVDNTLSYVSVGPRFGVAARRFRVVGLVAPWYQVSRSSAHSFTRPAYSGEPGTTAGEIVTRTAPAKSVWAAGLQIGGGLEFDLNRRLAVRAIQVNYDLYGFGEGPGLRLRFKSGLVLRL